LPKKGYYSRLADFSEFLFKNVPAELRPPLAILMFGVMVFLCAVLIPGTLTEEMKWAFIGMLVLIVLIGAVLYTVLLIGRCVWLTTGERALVAQLDNLEAGLVNGVNGHISNPIGVLQTMLRTFFLKLR
jgi:hypothetical protein